MRRAARARALKADVVLPRHNGVDLWRQAVKQRPELRVVFMSGHLHHPSLSQRPIPSGAPLLAKPFSQRALIEEVQNAVSSLASHHAPS